MNANNFKIRLETEINQALDVILELASDKANIADNINALSNLVAHIECNLAQIDTLNHPRTPTKVNFKRNKEM